MSSGKSNRQEEQSLETGTSNHRSLSTSRHKWVVAVGRRPSRPPRPFPLTLGAGFELSEETASLRSRQAAFPKDLSPLIFGISVIDKQTKIYLLRDYLY